MLPGLLLLNNCGKVKLRLRRAQLHFARSALPLAPCVLDQSDARIARTRSRMRSSTSIRKAFFRTARFAGLTTHSSVGRAMGPKVIGTVSYRTGMLLNLSAGRAIPLYHRLPATQVCWIPDQKTPLFFWNSTSGGVTPDGLGLDPTYDFLPSDSLTLRELSRAIYTIRVLDLNREVLRVARANAFGGFRARLHEYADKRDEDASVTILEGLKNDLLRTPHLTVFAEMRRQRSSLPEIDALFSRAPESVQWPLVPTVR